MITLHDYIGGLVSSVARARAVSDLQATKVAEDYAGNALLAHLPVPRMRIQSVEMTVPAAIDETQVDRRIEYEPIDNRRFSAAAYREILDALGLESLPRDASRSMKRMLSEKIGELEASIRSTGSDAPLADFAKRVAAEAVCIARTSRRPDEGGTGLAEGRVAVNGEEAARAVIEERLQTALRSRIRLRSERVALESLRVTVEADKLRERDPRSLIYVKLLLNEEGVEWHRMETPEGERVSRLLPE